jgi:hypothetical protein
MRRRTWTASVAGLAAGACLAATALAAPVPVYKNDMSSTGKRAGLRVLGSGRCNRGGSDVALRVRVGKRTAECAYRTPVVGRDLEIFATERLLSGTPASIRGRTFVGLGLRAGDGNYKLEVRPAAKAWRLRRVEPGGGSRVLGAGRAPRIGGINEANEMRLRAFNLTATADPDDCRLLASVNGVQLAAVTDPAAGPLAGRFSTVSVGSTRNARGAVASFDDLIVRVPDPFAG